MGLLEPNIEKLKESNDVDGLIKALYFKRRKEVRIGAAKVLGEIKNVKAVPPLIEALKDKEHEVRVTAAEALENIGDPRAVLPLYQVVKFDDYTMRMLDEFDELTTYFPVRNCAENALKNIRGREVLESYIQILNDGIIRATAVYVLGEIKDSRAVEPLIQAFENSSPNNRGLILQALEKIGDNRSLEIFLRATNDNQSYTEYIREKFNYQEYTVQEKAEEILLKMHNNGKIRTEHIIRSLIDNDPVVRIGAAHMLGKIRDTRAVEPLIEALEDNDLSVREKSAEALGIIKDKRAAEPLIKSLKEKRVDKRRIEESLMGLEDGAVNPLINSLKGENEDIQMAVIELLGKIRNKSAIDPLVQVMKHENPEIRREAMIALDNIGWKPPNISEQIAFLMEIKPYFAIADIGEPAIEPLIAIIKDESSNSENRIKALKAIQKIGDPKAVEPLIQTLKDENSYIRNLAAEFLGNMGDKRAVDPLIQTLNDENIPVRQQVALALGKIGDIKAVEPLTHSLEDEHEHVRKVAKEALEKIESKMLE